FQEVKLEDYILRTDVPNLYLLKAGRFDDQYSFRVSTFDWEDLYNRSPWLIHAFAGLLAERYVYVIVDSRTGISDESGICTMLMPEKLVCAFTPNRQSLLGARDLIRRATRYRRQSDDFRPLAVFPLPSRIEATEPDLRQLWRLGNREQDVIGYQPLFEELFKEVYDLSRCDLDSYFNEVQIQQVPKYSYGEEIAVLLEQHGDRLSLAQSYENFTERLVNCPVPWE